MRCHSFVRRVVLATGLACTVVAAPAAASVEVSRGPDGYSITATGAPVEDVLDALAKYESFTVTMQPGVDRPPVDAYVRDATLEEALRRVLRKRNYAIAYRETSDGLVVDRVDLLLPRTPDEAQQAEQDPRQARAEAAMRAAAQRNEERRRQQAEQRFEQMRAERQRQREQRQQAAQAARAAARAQAQPEPLPLRRLLWSRGSAQR
jgi:regulator of protease activity HflC (stomatin/prohibitin superfamily)